MRFSLFAAFVLISATAVSASHPFCNPCTSVIQKVEDFIGSQKTIGFLVGLAEDDICPLFGKDVDKCDSISEMVIPYALSWLEDNIDPSAPPPRSLLPTTASTAPCARPL